MPTLERQKIWDPVTRLWHWALALSVMVGWYLGEWRSFSTIQWHFYLGYTTAGLVLFRYLWGFIGPQPIRHATLFRALPHVLTYMRHAGRREPSGVAGHNPMGALSIIAIVLALTVQVSSGVFSEDDGLFSAGPFADYVSSSTIRFATKIHNINAKVILGLVITHLSAIAFYWLWKRENLVGAMFSGWKWVRKD